MSSRSGSPSPARKRTAEDHSPSRSRTRSPTRSRSPASSRSRSSSGRGGDGRQGRYSRSRRSRTLSGTPRSRSPRSRTPASAERGGGGHQSRELPVNGVDRERPEPSHILGVFGLNFDTTEKELTRVFCKYGRLEKVHVVLDGPSKRSRGFAFIYFERVDDAVAAREALNGTELAGFSIRVDFSITKEAHRPTPGIYFHHGKATRPGEVPRGGRGGYRGGGGDHRGGGGEPGERREADALA